MILNKLYKLKKKRGAVLFVVIAMMTLLVIMATAAYYTARGSYATVIRNYDFSQVYMSAISVSDMMIDAVTNDAVEDSTGRNNYTALQKALIDDNFTVGKKITAKSSKITSSMTTAEQILAQTADNPEIAGILDAVEVEITHEKKDNAVKEDGTPISGLYWSYYRLTTTAYYRGNTITIQDRIVREYGSHSDPPEFNTFFTATGRRPDDLDRSVVIDMKNVTGDAYFENTYTVFGSNDPNKITHALISSGSVWGDQFNADVDLDYKNWFIGGSFIMDQMTSIDLGNNILVVGGDLIILDNKDIKAKNVYVKGDVYYLGSTQGKVDGGGLYVGGSIKSVASSEVDALLTKMHSTYKTLCPGAKDLPGASTRSGSGKFTGGTGTVTGWTPSATDTVVLEDGADPVRIDEALTARTTRTEYKNYTSKAETLKNVFTIQFDTNLYSATGSYSFPIKVNGSTGSQVATATYDGSKYTINLPYVTDGYVLDLDFANSNANAAIDYIIDSGNSEDSSLPIVLKPNFNQPGAGDSDVKGNNAFSWYAPNANAGNTNSFIQVKTAQNCLGDVFLEVGNYTKDGELCTYSSGVCTALYDTNAKLQIGTYNQLSVIGGKDIQNTENSDLKSMFTDSTLSQLKSTYDNQFMLISNKTGSNALDFASICSNFCGYVYAPFASLDNWSGPGNLPVIGGMIVSDYSTHLSYYAYSKPDGKLMQHLGNAMSSGSVEKSGPSKWYTSGDSQKNIGANFVG